MLRRHYTKFFCNGLEAGATRSPEFSATSSHMHYAMKIPAEQFVSSICVRPRPGYRPDIDGLRAIAVLAVVGFHVFPQWFRGGFAGVDIFFVISGFLISNLVFAEADSGNFDLSGFYVRRIRRIFPALILVLVVVWCAGWAYLLPDDFMRLGKHIAGSAGFVANFMLWGESGYFDKAATTKPLLHIWSLGVEEQFYLVMPLLWALAWRLRIRVVALTLTLIALSFALSVIMMASRPVGAFYSPLTRIWEFLLGSLLAAIPLAREQNQLTYGLRACSRWIPNDIKSFVGIIFIGGSIMSADKRAFPGWSALVPTLGACLLVAAGPFAWLNRNLLASRMLVGIGLISYPLYLWHWPLMAFLSNVFPGIPPLPLGSGLLAIAICIALAGTTYYLIEKPIRFGKRLPTASLIVAMALTAILGFATWEAQGFKSRFRFDKHFEELMASKDNLGTEWRRRVRKGQCFLDVDDARFGDCVERDRRPLLVLWGDSHAASLYIGLRNLQEREQFAVAQFNVSSCPPLPDFIGVNARRNCPVMSRQIFESVISLSPQIVLLHGNWESEDYGLYQPDTGKYDFNKLTQTVRNLKEAGIQRIILVGPAPYWHWYLPDLIVSYYRWDALHRMPPARMKTSDALPIIDAQMRRFAATMGIEFLSIADVMCDENGCLTRLGDDFSTITSLDRGHLTPQTSIYLINQFADRIMGREKY